MSTRAVPIAPAAPVLRPAIRSQSPIADADQRIGVMDSRFDAMPGANEGDEPAAESMRPPIVTPEGSRTYASDILQTGDDASKHVASPLGGQPDKPALKGEGSALSGKAFATPTMTAGDAIPNVSTESLEGISESTTEVTSSVSRTDRGVPGRQPQEIFPESPIGKSEPLAAPEAKTPSYLDAVPVGDSAIADSPRPSSPPPQVVIDQLIVEVVPPNDNQQPKNENQAKSDTQSAQGNPQGPVSLIGPLGNSVSSQVRFGLRYR